MKTTTFSLKQGDYDAIHSKPYTLKFFKKLDYATLGMIGRDFKPIMFKVGVDADMVKWSGSLYQLVGYLITHYNMVDDLYRFYIENYE